MTKKLNKPKIKKELEDPKGSTTWIPNPVLNKIKSLQTLRGDEHMSTTIKFLLLKALADLSFLSTEEKQALGMSETGLDRLYAEQVLPMFEKLSSIWNEKHVNYLKATENLAFKDLTKADQFAFLYWLKGMKLL
jgi:hypothetical protein